MTVTVNKATILKNVFKNFYDLIVAISGFSTIVWPTFPYNILDAKGDYPVIVINSPEISWEPFTLSKNVVEGTISIDVFTNTPSETDTKADLINNKIETSKRTLADVGLRQVNLDSTSTDMASQGKIKVHLKTSTFKFKFYFTNTSAY